MFFIKFMMFGNKHLIYLSRNNIVLSELIYFFLSVVFSLISCFYCQIMLRRYSYKKRKTRNVGNRPRVFYVINKLNYNSYTIPCAIIALATFMKPAMLAPFT